MTAPLLFVVRSDYKTTYLSWGNLTRVLTVTKHGRHTWTVS